MHTLIEYYERWILDRQNLRTLHLNNILVDQLEYHTTIDSRTIFRVVGSTNVSKATTRIMMMLDEEAEWYLQTYEEKEGVNFYKDMGMMLEKAE